MDIGKELFQNMKKSIVIENYYKIKKEILLKTISFIFVLAISGVIFFNLEYFFRLQGVYIMILLLLVLIFIFKILDIFDNIIESKIKTIPDNEIMALVSPLELKKYQIKAGDLITYKNGFKFSESCYKLQVQKISSDGTTLLFTDMDGKYKEISVKDFFTLAYEV